MATHSEPELLTVEEFAVRLRVGRSTIFFWIACKKMIQGTHYFKIGKTIRIPWSMELLADLSTMELTDTDSKPERSRKYQNNINLNY